jgi:hypothetical protein
MSDKVLLTLVGLLMGFTSFAAIGAATSLVMAEVQELKAPQAAPVYPGYAQMRGHMDYVTR